jgi:hypothetical protein
MKLPGQALAVGLIIWREAGIRNSLTMPLQHARLREAEIKKDTSRRALRSLEMAGLVTISRPPGRCLEVTILETSAMDRKSKPN